MGRAYAACVGTLALIGVPAHAQLNTSKPPIRVEPGRADVGPSAVGSRQLPVDLARPRAFERMRPSLPACAAE